MTPSTRVILFFVMPSKSKQNNTISFKQQVAVLTSYIVIIAFAFAGIFQQPQKSSHHSSKSTRHAIASVSHIFSFTGTERANLKNQTDVNQTLSAQSTKVQENNSFDDDSKNDCIETQGYLIPILKPTQTKLIFSFQTSTTIPLFILYHAWKSFLS